MSGLWPILPIVVPMLSAIAGLFALRSAAFQRVVSVAGSLAGLAVAIALLAQVRDGTILTLTVGNWPAPFGITFVVDLFSAIMVVMAALVGLTVVLYSIAAIDEQRIHFGYFPLVQALIMGVSGAFLTGDLFNLYVWFEVLLMASFVLLTLGNRRTQLRGAMKYVTLNLLASTVFLLGIGFLYGVTGTLNLADMRGKLALVDPALVNTLSMLLLVAFGSKAAMFPFFFWLPDSYHTPPVAVTTLFSGLLTKVGVYALIRTFTVLFDGPASGPNMLILAIAGATMVTGVLGAVAQYDVRRLLSFHIVSQIGYLLMGLGLFTGGSLAAAVFFMVHVIIAKSALFLMAGVVQHLTGLYDLKRQGGLYRARPWLAVLFLTPALALAGIPPLSGFWAKLFLLDAGLRVGQYGIVLIALLTSILTLYSMVKIWNEAYWKKRPADAPEAPPAPTGLRWAGLVAPVVALAALTVVIGVFAGPMYDLSLDAGMQLANPDNYALIVLGQ